MKQNLRKFCLALLSVVLGSVVAMADDGVLYTWDFTNSESACTKAVGGTGVYKFPSDVDANVVLDVDASQGKFWARGTDVQVNATSVIKVPVKAKGDVITVYNYPGYGVTYNIGAETKTNDNQVYSYTVGAVEASLGYVAITVTGSGYMHKFSVLQHEAEKTSFSGDATYTRWRLNSSTDYSEADSISPSNVMTLTSVVLGTCTISGTGQTFHTDSINMLKVRSTSTKDDLISWNVKPAKGLTFTPVRVSGDICRGATDVESGVTISVKAGDGSPVKLGTYTAARYNKTKAEDKYGAKDNYAKHFDITLTADQQAALTTQDVFSLLSTVGVGSGKDGWFSNIVIEGKVSGEIEAVEKYSLTTSATPSDGGTVNVYPKVDQYDKGTEVTLTAVPNFGYHFVNWTDADGTELSTDAQFTYEVNADSEIKANFTAVATHELKMTTEGGADYMVTYSPEPTIVNGKKMYEEGQTVTITALENKVISFSSWSSGETSKEIVVNMDGDKELTATFSASDFIAAWDFILAGNESRKADFYSEGNDAATLVLRDEAGNTYSWLDKSQSKGGYEGRPGAVNWKNDAPLGTYYWQTKVDASAFTSIKLLTAMVFNYNAYKTYNVDYSLNGVDWTNLGSITVTGAKNWTDAEFALPSECNNKSALYIRWIADRNSPIAGSESTNDGNGLGAIYITGAVQIVNDGLAPVLLSSVPSEGSNTASASGRVVLNFDEKVQVDALAKATLNGVQIAPSVSGKSVSFEYHGLAYSTDYTFRLPANSVADLSGNKLASDIVINFSTKARAAVAKGAFDAIVSSGEELAAAITAANTRADKSVRYRIFVTPGTHVIPASTTQTVVGGDNVSYADPRTVLSASNVSIVGLDYQSTSFTNVTPGATWDNGYGPACPLEGIGKGDVLMNYGSNNYFQGITIRTSMGDSHGRDIAFNDQGDRTIFKNARLMGYQDTYVSNNQNGRFYFENGVLRGRTDYLCGKGDVFYNGVTLQQVGTGGYLAVPSQPKKYGYVFSECKIVNETPGVTYYLGRPWGSGTPIALFINTVMQTAPIAAGWAEMSGGWPARFAEYGSVLSTGTAVELSNRKKFFTSDNHENNPVLTAEEAAGYTIAKVMGEGDNWDPTYYTEQAPVPTNVTVSGNTISWDASDYAFCWVVFKGNEYVGQATSSSFTVDNYDSQARYYVYAANEMGGFSAGATVVDPLGIDEVVVSASSSLDASAPTYNVAGQAVRSSAKGVLLQKGKKVLQK